MDLLAGPLIHAQQTTKSMRGLHRDQRRAVETARTLPDLTDALHRVARRHAPRLATILLAEAVRQMGAAALGRRALTARLAQAIEDYGDAAVTALVPVGIVPADHSVPRLKLIARLKLITESEMQASRGELAEAYALRHHMPVTRVTDADPCEACQARAGTYYPPYPAFLFQSHPNCRCSWMTDRGGVLMPYAAREAVIGRLLSTLREALLGGRWITIEDNEGVETHLYVSKGGPGNAKKGTVIAGPAHLHGADIAHLPAAPHFRHTEHPVGHEPKGAKDHPSYAEHQFSSKERVYGKRGPGVGREVTVHNGGPEELTEEETAAGFAKAHGQSRKAAGIDDEAIAKAKAAAAAKAAEQAKPPKAPKAPLNAEEKKAAKRKREDAKWAKTLAGWDKANADRAAEKAAADQAVQDHYAAQDRAAAHEELGREIRAYFDRHPDSPLMNPDHVKALRALIDAGHKPNLPARIKTLDFLDSFEAKKDLTGEERAAYTARALGPEAEHKGAYQEAKTLAYKRGLTRSIDRRGAPDGMLADTTSYAVLRAAVLDGTIKTEQSLHKRVGEAAKMERALAKGTITPDEAVALRDMLVDPTSENSDHGWKKEALAAFTDRMDTALTHGWGRKLDAEIQTFLKSDDSLHFPIGTVDGQSTPTTGEAAATMARDAMAAEATMSRNSHDHLFVRAAGVTLGHTDKRYEDLYGQHGGIKRGHSVAGTCAMRSEHPPVEIFNGYSGQAGTIVHEMGHAIDALLARALRSKTHMSEHPDFTALYEANKENQGLREYMRSKPVEFFADGYHMYKDGPQFLRDVCPALHDYFTTKIEPAINHYMVAHLAADQNPQESAFAQGAARFRKAVSASLKHPPTGAPTPRESVYARLARWSMPRQLPPHKAGTCASPDESGEHDRPIDDGPPGAHVARPARSFNATFLEPLRSALS